MAISLKGRKPNNFESHNYLKHNFANIPGLCSNFADCESFLNQTLLTLLLYVWNAYSMLDKPGNSIDSGNFSVSYLPLIRKDSVIYLYTWSRSLCEGRTSFSVGLISIKFCGLLLISMVFSCLCCCHSSWKSLFSFVTTEQIF